MGMTRIFHGKITQGKLQLDSPSAYLRQIAALEGQQIELVLRKHKSHRSNQQNAWYWGVIVELISQHTGYTPSEAHEALKFRFLSDHNPDHQGLIKIKSTSQLSTKEFAEYCDRIVRWAAEHMEIFIPDPGQVDYQ